MTKPFTRAQQREAEREQMRRQALAHFRSSTGASPYAARLTAAAERSAALDASRDAAVRAEHGNRVRITGTISSWEKLAERSQIALKRDAEQDRRSVPTPFIDPDAEEPGATSLGKLS
jgi:hypothetical protein